MHIYTLPFLAGHNFPLSVLVIFPLTKLFLTCTTSAHWTIDSHLYCHIPYIRTSHLKFQMSDPIRSNPQIRTRSIMISFFIHILFI
ncbi:hypothetical protein BD769DRAFT_1458728 [Suillus cothurnatus]|nr:hypothetical protein BD769DRAFT_1458728 [Suillus cothurnatus]